MTERHPEYQYLDLLREIKDKGTLKMDRTGVGTKYLFGKTMRFDLSKSFPLFSTRKAFFKGIVEELLFFLSGKTDSKVLENKGVKIWAANTSREFLDNLIQQIGEWY